MNQLINTNKQINKSTNFRKFDIHDRIFNFVVNVLKLIRTIPKSIENQIIVNQIIRSATSIGANDQEADGVSTKKDFIHCFTVVRKELKETRYWLRIISAINEKVSLQMHELLQENKELIYIVSSIIKNSFKKHQIG
ncbi:hypothetical protein A3D78_03755 [Candidatus Gottesmanbacteria bacterium RIFCSPHIGHO2_02_FULL_39_14]|uniref:Four helix bundle protein n=1 Tax=Candidatus Gottesmanbacteria bacterium RIFCSPHIGHO2_02_FULL_39_14 TaxID=1798383 RepID=A0A1F5ZXS8_9BACT|nr:MAG: hypothetical protein A3D78_03755 [Candidatus Gottesmanbacteria bacterium RIFCSPHIGHO2_02_FULL_39_14]